MQINSIQRIVTIELETMFSVCNVSDAAEFSNVNTLYEKHSM